MHLPTAFEFIAVSPDVVEWLLTNLSAENIHLLPLALVLHLMVKRIPRAGAADDPPVLPHTSGDASGADSAPTSLADLPASAPALPDDSLEPRWLLVLRTRWLWLYMGHDKQGNAVLSLGVRKR